VQTTERQRPDRSIMRAQPRGRDYPMSTHEPRKLLQAEVESATPRGNGCMKRNRFTEEQIIGVLREQEAGMKVAEVCRKHGVSEPTFYAWKAKFGGMSVSDAKRLKQLEEENAKLKRLLAEAMLDVAVLKDITSRKW